MCNAIGKIKIEYAANGRIILIKESKSSARCAMRWTLIKEQINYVFERQTLRCILATIPHQFSDMFASI